MERALGLLEGKFAILLKIVDIPLHHMSNLVMVCICWHNMLIVNSNGFDMDYALKAQKESQAKTNSTFDNIKGVDKFKVVEKRIKQMKRL